MCIRDSIDSISSNYQIDQNRIYACGYSLGGEFSYELACKLNNKIAAIGAVARTMQANPSTYCTPVHPTGVLTILGTNDFISPYNGVIFGGVEYYISAAATHGYWATFNNCNPTASMSTVSPSVERYTWSTGSECAYVEELKVIGGGHDWPGSFGNSTIDASQEIWQFVSRYNLNGLIGCAPNSTNQTNDQNEALKVYPNPFHQQLTIEVHDKQNQEFHIYSILGNVIRKGKVSSSRHPIDLSLLAPGTYVLKIGNQTIQLMKTK